MSYEADARTRQVQIPFLRHPVGSGDVVARMTRRLGIKPCKPCEERRRRMNRWLQFVPRR